MSRAAEQVRKIVRKKEPEGSPDSAWPDAYLSTGCTLLNLAISDRADGGFVPGKYYFLVGDSSSGKTFLSMTCFAEAVRHPFFKDYDLYYDNGEDGMLMDVRKLFGLLVEKRMRPPRWRKEGSERLPVFSETIEELYYSLDSVIKRSRKTGRPFVYIQDSMDSLTSEAEDEKFEENKEKWKKGKEAKGSYGDGKAKKNAAGIRRVLRGLRETGSILIIICQTRDNVGAVGPFAPKKTRSGGRALRFYATTEIWSSITGAVKKKVRGKDRKIGTKIKLQLQKNRVTGKLHEVETVIYPRYGIDDTGSIVDYLVAEKFWKKKAGRITVPELGFKGKRDALVSLCDSGKGRKRLLRAAQECWDQVDQACELDGRKARYQ